MAGRPKGLVKTGGRQKGTPNRNTSEKREATQEFFARIIDDETEAKFWRYFITGYQLSEREDGSTEIIPIPLNAIAFSAFKRAVEYKRGLPVQNHLIERAGIDYGLGSIPMEVLGIGENGDRSKFPN